MAAAGILAFLVLLIGVPVILVNRDVIGGGLRLRRRRHRKHSGALPFLFFPTSGRTQAHASAPAWNQQGLHPTETARPIHTEPGIADLPPVSEQGIVADLPLATPERRIADLWPRSGRRRTDMPDHPPPVSEHRLEAED